MANRFKASGMAETKLTLYIRLIESLRKHGPISINKFAQKTNIDEKEIKRIMKFLIEINLAVSERSSATIERYNITDRGIRVLEFFESQKTLKLPPLGFHKQR